MVHRLPHYWTSHSVRTDYDHILMEVEMCAHEQDHISDLSDEYIGRGGLYHICGTQSSGETSATCPHHVAIVMMIDV